MKALIACEFSDTVSKALREKGHDVTSCDLLPSEGNGKHYQGDVRNVLNKGFDIMIAFPPCTYLCNSGVRWLTTQPARWGKMLEAASLFRELLDAPIPRIAIENPIPHRYALEAIGRKYDEIIQPWWFGDGETKATCLWLINLPPLMASVVRTERIHRIHLEPPSLERAKNRSRTYKGIAQAMAAQWG